LAYRLYRLHHALDSGGDMDDHRKLQPVLEIVPARRFFPRGGIEVKPALPMTRRLTGGSLRSVNAP